MRFLADENFPADSIAILKENGFETKSVFEEFRGKPDLFLLEEAIRNEEIILTFDKDFGELVFKSFVKNCRGIVLFRIENFFPGDPAYLLLSLLKNKQLQLENYFTVIDEDKIRQRPII